MPLCCCLLEVCCGRESDETINSQGTISLKKPDGCDAIEVGHWECAVVADPTGDDDNNAPKKADDNNNNASSSSSSSRGVGRGKKGPSGGKGGGDADSSAKAEAKPPFLKSAFPHLPASDAPLPRGDGPDAKDWHWLELPADTISAAGCYVVEFSLSTGDDKLKISGVAAMASDEYLVEFKSRTWSEELSEDERRRHMCQARLRPKQSSAAAAASSSSADHRKPPPKRLSGARDGGGGGGATERRRLRYLNFNAEDDEVDVALDASGAVTKLTLGGEAVPFKRIFILPKVSADGRVASKDPSPLLREEGTNERPATVCISSSSSPRRRTSARRSTCGSTRPSRSTARCG